MAETWGSVYYEVLGQIDNLTLSDMSTMSVRNPERKGHSHITTLENFLEQRYAEQSLTSLSQAEMKELEQAFNRKVIELTNGTINSHGTGVTYSQ